MALVRGTADRFALALIDMTMPGMRGIDLARRLADEPAGATVPVLLLDSGDSTLAPEQCAGTRVRGILKKPICQAVLYDRIAAILRTGEPADEGVVEIGGVTARAASRLDQLGAHVLLAEDNPVNEMIACDYLKQLGCSVEVARTGFEAVQAIADGGHDVVLMDCQMPEMGGLEATRRIRMAEAYNGSRRRIPIIALTANAFSEDREQCLAAGMDDYLAKPFTPEALAGVIGRHLPSRGAAAAGAGRAPPAAAKSRG